MAIPLQYALLFCDMVKRPENLNAGLSNEPFELVSSPTETGFKNTMKLLIEFFMKNNRGILFFSTTNISVLLLPFHRRVTSTTSLQISVLFQRTSLFSAQKEKAHDGFYGAAQEIFLKERDSIFSLARLLDYSIVVIGHSLGGATATILTMLLKNYAANPEVTEENPNGAYRISGIAFGAPPSISENLSLKTLDFMKTYVIEKDPVPYCWELSKKVAQSDLIDLGGKSVRVFATLLSGLFLNNNYCLGGEVHVLKTEACEPITVTNGKEFQTFSIPMEAIDAIGNFEVHSLINYISKLNV